MAPKRCPLSSGSSSLSFARHWLPLRKEPRTCRLTSFCGSRFFWPSSRVARDTAAVQLLILSDDPIVPSARVRPSSGGTARPELAGGRHAALGLVRSFSPDLFTDLLCWSRLYLACLGSLAPEAACVQVQQPSLTQLLFFLGSLYCHSICATIRCRHLRASRPVRHRLFSQQSSLIRVSQG